MRASDKIKAAAAATDIVSDAFNAGRDSLSACWVNGAGVLSDPSMTRSRLGEAKAAIDRALAAMRSCGWPTDADYDEEETERCRDILR